MLRAEPYRAVAGATATAFTVVVRQSVGFRIGGPVSPSSVAPRRKLRRTPLHRRAQRAIDGTVLSASPSSVV